MLAEVHEADMMTLEFAGEMLLTVLRNEKDCRDKAEADITAMKEKFNQKYLQLTYVSTVFYYYFTLHFQI
jgi:hypothetical protein